MEQLWFAPPGGEEINISGTFDFARLNSKIQKLIRMRTMEMVLVLGENDEHKAALFKRLIRMMCKETGKAVKALQSRLDACKLSVHCLYDIVLNDASDSKMVDLGLTYLIEGQFQTVSSRHFIVCNGNSIFVLRRAYDDIEG